MTEQQAIEFVKAYSMDVKELKSCANCTSAYRWDEATGGSIFRCKNPLSGAYNTAVTKSECCDRHRNATSDWIKYLSGKAW